MNDEKSPAIRVRYGPDGYEVEGPEGFVSATLPKLQADYAELIKKVPQAAASSPPSVAATGAPSVSLTEASTNTIASMIDAKSGSDLALAAIAQIQLVQKKPAAVRRDILEEMKGAITFYRDSFSGNLTASLDTLAKGKKINMVAKDTFSLANAERQRFERLLSEAA